jgi:hypothetical protein
MPVTLENRDRNLRAGHSGDFAGKSAGVMRSMRKLEAKNIPPKG